jgi:hypothetical protein
MFTFKVTRKVIEKDKMIVTFEPVGDDVTVSGTIIKEFPIDTQGIFIDNLYDVQPHVEPTPDPVAK